MFSNKMICIQKQHEIIFYIAYFSDIKTIYLLKHMGIIS